MVVLSNFLTLTYIYQIIAYYIFPVVLLFLFFCCCCCFSNVVIINPVWHDLSFSRQKLLPEVNCQIMTSVLYCFSEESAWVWVYVQWPDSSLSIYCSTGFCKPSPSLYWLLLARPHRTAQGDTAAAGWVTRLYYNVQQPLLSCLSWTILIITNTKCVPWYIYRFVTGIVSLFCC